MRHKLFATFILALGLSGPLLSAPAQELVEYRFLPGLGKTPPGAATGPAADFRAAEAKVAAARFDPAATALLAAAEKFTKSVFNVPSLRFQRAATERIPAGAQRGDVLVAEWSFEEAFGSGVVVLTDTPYYSTYAFRLRDCHLSTQAEMTAFLGTALVFGKSGVFPSPWPPVEGPNVGGILPSPWFAVTLPAGTPPITYFGGVRSPSPYDWVADFEINGLFEGEEWFLTFGVGKSYTQRVYPVRAYIPERFPPLGELAKSWSFAQIRGEIGRQVKPFEGVPDYMDRRDTILIAELARRGLSEAQMVEILTDVPMAPDALNHRLGAVSEGVDASGTGPFATRFFMAAFKEYERIGPAASKSMTTLFGLASVPKCQIDVEALALDVLKKGVFQEGPVEYLESCSNSGETLAALRAMRLPTEWLERLREFAVRSIQNRVEQPARKR